MVIAEKERITLKMRTDSPYQSKCSRGFGRVEAREGKVEKVMPAEKMPYRPNVKLCLDRARLITESYKQTEGQPIVIRRAKALAHYFDKMNLYILPHERIVGNIAGKPGHLITFPELWWSWLDKAIEGDYRNLIDDENERQELHKIHEYWRGRAVHGMERDLLPEDVKPYWYYDKHGAFRWVHGAHIGTANHEKIFKVGVKGIIEEAEKRLKEITSDPACYLNAPEYLKQKSFLEAAIISCKGLIRLGKRFADKAREMALKEKDEKGRLRFEEIAKTCDWVPENPPRNFHEALQCYWFVLLGTRVLDLQSSGYGERIDQILYPFYQKDVEERKLTSKEAQELVEHLFLKMNEEGSLALPVIGTGSPVITRAVTVGGQKRDGTDATNDLTYIVLDARADLGLVQPCSLAIRLHRNSPKKLYEKTIDALHRRSAAFALFNDEMMIPYLMSFGVPLEDAREYTTDGCMRWIIPGKAMAFRAWGGSFVLPRCLELALYQGMDKFTGKQLGARTADPLTFKSLEDLIQAYYAQVRFFLEKLIVINNIVDVLDGEWLPQPLLSAFMDGCIEHGRDCREYKYIANTLIMPLGQVTVVNSLAAIKKLVFDEKKVSMGELIDVLKKNWEGHEELRRLCLEAPKFGNDDDYVDLIARDIYLRNTQTFRSFKNNWGQSYREDGTAGSTYYQYSGFTGATADGRKDRDVFNDGTISPYPGTDKKGPTAVLNSVAKVDHVRTFTQLFNQKFNPSCFEGDDNKEKFIAYLKTWLDLRIHHIQFNIINKDMLLDAQKNPQKYPDMIVRVAGFAAYFVDLAKEVQDQLIARTEQGI